MTVGLYLNITVCLDNCSKGSASFLCLYTVVQPSSCELKASLCLSFQVIYRGMFWVKLEFVTGIHFYTHTGIMEEPFEATVMNLEL